MLNPFKATKKLNFDVTVNAAPEKVWAAWTESDQVKNWWGPDGVEIVECEVSPVVGGAVKITMQAGESMGKYKGTLWPMEGTFTAVEVGKSFTYEAISWTDGEKEVTSIFHTTSIEITTEADKTKVKVTVDIKSHGPKAKLAAFGMKFGYNAQFKKLAKLF